MGLRRYVSFSLIEIIHISITAKLITDGTSKLGTIDKLGFHTICQLTASSQAPPRYSKVNKKILMKNKLKTKCLLHIMGRVKTVTGVVLSCYYK